LGKIGKRLERCGLELNKGKTKIVYCKANRRKKNGENVSFDFLGYTFRLRGIKTKEGRISTGFLPAISRKSKKVIRQKVREWKLQYKTGLTLNELAKMYNSQIQGWIN